MLRTRFGLRGTEIGHRFAMNHAVPQTEEFAFCSTLAILSTMPDSPPHKIIHVDMNACFASAEQRDVGLSEAASPARHRENIASELALEGQT
jgi:hypothetical protein